MQSIVPLLLQGIPAIPPGIKQEGLLAVLFMVLLGFLAVMYALRQLPAAIKPLAEAVSTLAKSYLAMVVSLDALTAAAKASEAESQAIREHIHDRITPAIAGLTIAWLRRAGYHEEAEQLAKQHPEAVLPPNPR